MRRFYFSVALLWLVVGVSSPVTALDSAAFETYKKICADIGFIPKTEKFGECVIQIVEKEKHAASDRKAASPQAPTSNADQSAQEEQLRLQREQLQLQYQMMARQRQQAEENKEQQELQALYNLFNSLNQLSNPGGAISPRPVAPSMPKNIDLGCVSNCTKKGNLLLYCNSLCSF
jgi:hypothetical protein